MEDRKLYMLVALHAYLVSGRPLDNAIEAAIATADALEQALNPPHLRDAGFDEPSETEAPPSETEPPKTTHKRR